MKKLFKGMAMMFALVGILFLASCGKVTKSFADEINSAASKGEHLQLEEVMEKLGNNASFNGTDGTGYVKVIKGVEAANTTAIITFNDKIQDKPNTKIEVIKIEIKDYLATNAKYFKGTLDEGYNLLEPEVLEKVKEKSFDDWFEKF
ncbi:MAG: hypothetical protein K2O05_02620 [Anaeroplasmataceae bacterium]|nr:hypothetical protein [Anaeroplasmataceae bacterium]